MTYQRRFGKRIPGADSDDECDRQVVESFGEVAEKAQRRLIGPRQIVYQYRHRTLLGEVDGEPIEAVQNAAFVCSLTVAEQRLSEGSGSVQQQLPCTGISPNDVGLEQIMHHAERMAARRFAAARPDDRHARQPGQAGALVEQP